MNTNTQSYSNVKQAVPFFMVANMSNSLDFYLNGLNFIIRHQWTPNETIEWCWLQLDNASIMLQEYRQAPPTEKRGEGVSIYFICEDALAIYQQIIKNGITASEPFVGNNMWVVGVKDPDGYNIFFESTTDVPEETTYSDWIKAQTTS